MTCTFLIDSWTSLGLPAKVDIVSCGISLFTRNLVTAMYAVLTTASPSICSMCLHRWVLKPHFVTGRTFRPTFTMTTMKKNVSWPMTLQVLTTRLLLHRPSFPPTRTMTK